MDAAHADPRICALGDAAFSIALNALGTDPDREVIANAVAYIAHARAVGLDPRRTAVAWLSEDHPGRDVRQWVRTAQCIEHANRGLIARVAKRFVREDAACLPAPGPEELVHLG